MPHPEGGDPDPLPAGRGESSAWQRVASDEVLLAHAGGVALQYGGAGARPVDIETVLVGPDPTVGEASQALVPAGV